MSLSNCRVILSHKTIKKLLSLFLIITVILCTSSAYAVSPFVYPSNVSFNYPEMFPLEITIGEIDISPYFGSAKLYFTVTNVSNVSLEQIYVSLKAYDSEGYFLSNAYGHNTNLSLQPGGKAKDYFFLTPEKSGAVNYDVICSYRIVGHTHDSDDFIIVDKIEPTYTEEGFSTAIKCVKCDEILAFKEAIPKLELNGWISENGKWYYYQQGSAVTNNWVNDGAWYYFDALGVMATGWQSIGGVWYYFKSSGAMVTGWLQDGATWYYFDASGAMATGTRVIGGTEYTFDASGAWVEKTIQTGWLQDGGQWYYYDESGNKVTGWKSISGTWYYFINSGAMQTGWQKISGDWYYFKSSGAMQTGWQKISGTWYYFKSSGAMQTGWLELKENQKTNWYWFDNSGAMATGWKEINGQWEMFDDSGLWLYTWVGN